MKTRIVDLLGLCYPAVQGGMIWVGRAGTAATVFNAGGLDILTALTQPTPQALREEIVVICADIADITIGERSNHSYNAPKPA